jgi:hypothetical protein
MSGAAVYIKIVCPSCLKLLQLIHKMVLSSMALAKGTSGVMSTLLLSRSIGYSDPL